MRARSFTPLAVVMLAAYGGESLEPARRTIAVVAHVAVSGPRAQRVDAWAAERGWQIVQDRLFGPDVLAVGLFGEEYAAPYASPSRTQREQRPNASRMPRLELRCENGVTALTLIGPVLAGAPPARSRTRREYDARMDRSAQSSFPDRRLVLEFEDNERIEIDPDLLRPDEPILLPDPYDNIGRLRRHDTLHFFEFVQGDFVRIDPMPGGWARWPDAVFHLEGLDDLLRSTRDPCDWRAS